MGRLDVARDLDVCPPRRRQSNRRSVRVRFSPNATLQG